MTLPSADVVAERRSALRRRIDERAPGRGVEITAVTKAFGPEILQVAVDAGCTVVGENYAQELRSKLSALEDLADAGRRPRVDFIGRLQSNKVRQLVGIVDRWCTVDRVALADEIAKRSPGAEVLVQVNTTGEAHKGGCPPGEVPTLVEHCRGCGLSVVGLLTVGPTGGGPAAARDGFVEVRDLVDRLTLPVASMGMSHDLDVALDCGATNVRLGTALFGPRPVSAEP